MVDTIRPCGSLTLGRQMSVAQFQLEEASKVTSPEAKTKACGIVQKTIATLKEFALQQESFWGWILRHLAKLFGIVTDYQKVLNQIDMLESKANALTEDAIDELQKLEDAKAKKQVKIEKSVGKLDKAFDEVEAAIVELKKRADSLTCVNKDFFELQQDLSQYQSYIAQMTAPLQKLNEIYMGDVEAFEKIPALWNKHKAAKEALQKIAAQLAGMVSKTQSDIITPSPAKEITLGGISQGGNTCYLASAMQAVNQIEEYRALFNPVENPLKQRTGESLASFEERKLIQRKGFFVLEKINSGNKVAGDEINQLRTACYNHKIDGKQVISTLGGTFDSMEVLGRMLRVLDYKDPQLTFEYEDVVDDETNFEVVNDGKERNPAEYSTIEETKKYQKKGCYTFSAFSYMNSSVSMETLSKEFLATETIDEALLKHISKTGEITYRKYKNVKRKKALNLEPKNLPKVLRITIQQLDGQRATITRPDIFYPSGKQGVGPKYTLKAIIEHLPGHYVAHVKTANGMLTANDGHVHEAASSSVPGYGYIYVRDDS